MPIIAAMLAAGIGIGIYADRFFSQSRPAHEDPPAKESIASAQTEATNPPDARDGTVQLADFNPQYVKSEPVAATAVPESMPVSGKLAFNAERLHLASARVSGRLDKILVFEGTGVKKGQPLAELYSPDFVSAENEYLLAKNTVRTLKEIGNPDLLEDARSTEQSAENKLRVLGASDEDIVRLAEANTASSHLTIRAPISGLVVKRNMDPGAFLNTGDNFMSIVDTSSLWFYGNIYEQDYSKVRLGQELTLEATALTGKKFSGKVTFIAPGIDPATHTLFIRCEVPNPGEELRPEMFVAASLLTGSKRGFIVPKTALVQIKDASYIIVDKGKGLFQRMPVTAAAYKDGSLSVLSGLKGDERVVVKGAVLVNNMIGNRKD